ncbi:Hsp20/alpha crystallin family protein [Amnibacterium sp.]|uniref:Hsp20/alpha crystallin family protein n=1 Tax=Amnibacterium sp. TaxID=1872496 RepID=UPI003F7C3942
MTLMGFDTFRDVDRLLEQNMPQGRRTWALPIEAFRHGDEYTVALDVPGVSGEDIDVKVERNVVSVRAHRDGLRGPDDEVLIDERPRGEFVRQLYLGESLDSGRLSAALRDGVLVLTIPVDESSKPRKVAVSSSPADETTASSGVHVSR